MRYFGRLLFFLTIVALTTNRFCAVGAAAQTSNAADRARVSMLIVSSHIAEHRDAIGAGVVVVIEPQRIRVITARHVVDHGPVTLWIAGRPLPAEIVRTFARSDLAIVDAFGQHLDRLPLQRATVAAATLPGNELVVWGENETGLRIGRGSMVAPVFAAPDASDVPGLMNIACEACAPGDSGGGIFDTSGRLVGILTARYFTRERTIAIVGERVNEAIFAADDTLVLRAITSATP